ncbi:hypothetical protein MAR_021652 [Mya arenaria]|uniref:Ig-like domain-containing protein n=1 Tax=Mya arenaria TaxID=6604 RepID=A0ABY7E8H8_MYAAR|nr:hypothetical protein MAR_021652 [Mya arenaria]
MTPDRRNVTVDVKCSPMYPNDYNHSTTIDTRPGEKAILNFSVFSNPPPIQFTWTNISNNMRIPIISSASDRVIIDTTDGMSSSLILTSVQPWDSGNYSVRVENEIGSMIETFLILVNINTDPASEPSTVANSGSGTGKVVGESDRLSDESTLNDDTRYEDLAMGPTRTPTEYSDLDFRCRTEQSRKQTVFKDSDVYENLKLTSTNNSASS